MLWRKVDKLEASRWKKRIISRRRLLRVLRLCLVLCLVAIFGRFLFRAFARSSFFCVQTIQVEGNREVSTGEIINSSRIRVGENIFAIRTKETRMRLMSLPGIKNIQIRRIFPRKISIKVQERIPVAELDEEKNPGYNKIKLVDKEGVIFLGTEKGLPRIRGNKDPLLIRKVVSFLSQVSAVDSDFYKSIFYVDSSNPRSVKVRTREGLIIWGEAGEETEEEVRMKLSYMNLVKRDLAMKGKTFNYLDLRFLHQGKGEIVVGL